MSDALTPDQLETLLETMEPQAIRDQFAQALSQSPECLAMLRHFEALDQNLSELKQLDPPPALKRPSPVRGTALLMRWALPLAAVIVSGFIWLFQTQPQTVPESPMPQAEESFTDVVFESPTLPESKRDAEPPVGKLALAQDQPEASKAGAAERRLVADDLTHHRGLQTDMSADQSLDVSNSLTEDELALDLAGLPLEMSPPAGVLDRVIAEHELTQTPQPQTPASQNANIEALLAWRKRFLALSADGKLNARHFAAEASIVLPHLNPKPMTLDEALKITSSRKAFSESWSAIQLPNGRPGLVLRTIGTAGILHRFELDEVGLCIRFEPYTP